MPAYHFTTGQTISMPLNVEKAAHEKWYNLISWEQALRKAYVDTYFTPKHIIYNQTTTIVEWTDGTKTVVHCAENDDFTEDGGFCAALAKKIYGERAKYMKFVKNATHQIRREDKKKLDKTDIV
jgi:hypothetical protein